MMRFAADENFNGNLLTALLDKMPNLDIIRIQDSPMLSASDPDLLDWLAEEGRILLTHDAKTIPAFAYERVHKGQSMLGVIIVREKISISQIVDELEIIIEAGEPSDFENIVRFIPL